MKIDRAKKLLGAKTEQDTIEQALDLVLGEEPILKVHRRVRAVGGFAPSPRSRCFNLAHIPVALYDLGTHA